MRKQIARLIIGLGVSWVGTSKGISIFAVPVWALDRTWNMVSPHLLRGLAVATDKTLKDVVDSIFAGTNCLWAIFEDGKIVGVFVTAVYPDDDGGRFLDVFALGGERIGTWGKNISGAMAVHAKEMGCNRIVFCGRKALLRLYEGVSIIGERKPGVYEFERAVL